VALGVKLDEDKLSLFSEFNKRCPVWMWCDKAVYILKKPTQVNWEGTFLHCDDGPSVEYNNEFKLWTINGVPVDEQIVMRPETQTLDQINQEKNEEVKRVRIDRFGWQSYLEQMQATVLDEQTNDIEQTNEALMECGEMRVLICSCPSTAKVFSLEFAKDVATCDQAQDWLHSGSSIDRIIPKTRVIGRT